VSIPQKETKVNLPKRLTREFYARDTHSVAQELLGKRLVRWLDGTRIAGRITEVEAYVGEEDRASHANPGPTPRNAPMYGPPGYTYIYLIYGIHHCLNIVTERDGFPAAVLIRAIEPIEGLATMRQLRGEHHPLQDLTRGPGRLCQALAVNLTLNNHDLCAIDAPMWIEEDASVCDAHITQSPRIGVRGDAQATNVPWRYYLRDSRWISGTKSFNNRA
jgi:DNA-3-methyladenine glycosylase